MSTILDAPPAVVLPDRYEVVNGEVVEVPPMSGLSSVVANRINIRLAVYAEQRQNGWPWMDILFRIPLPEDRSRNRAPDVSFVTFDRWPDSRPIPSRGNPVDVVPNLAVEVVSPTDYAEDLLAKVHEYLRAGAELVWVVFPRLRQLHAYTAVTTPARLFTEADTLDGGAVLPGFSVAMAGLFPVVADEPEAGADA